MPKLEVIKVFIASPGDLAEERKLFVKAIKQVNDIKAKRMNYLLEGLGWEDALPGGGRPQQIINDDVRECDVFVMLLWKRWGTPPSESFTSGTEEEFAVASERFRKTGHPHILLYFRSVPQAMMADPGEQLRRVIEFRTKIEVERNFLYKVYDKPKHWQELLVAHLSKWIDKVLNDQTNIHLSEPKSVYIPLEIEGKILALQRELEAKNAQLKTSQSKLRAEAVNCAVHATRLIEEGKFTLAEEKFAKAADLYDEPEILKSFGLFLRQIGSLDRAKEIYEKLLSISDVDSGAIHQDQAVALTGLGIIAATRGDLDEAEKMYEKAFEIDNSLAREKGIAIAYVNLGNVYMTRGDLNKAEEMYAKALQMNKTIGRIKGMATAYINLGNLYMSRADQAKAEEMYKEALDINMSIGRKEGVANAHVGIGSVLMNREELDKAKLEYEKALEIYKVLGRKKGIATVSINLGIIANQKGKRHEAERLWWDAARLFEELGNYRQVKKVQHWIAQDVRIEFEPTGGIELLDETATEERTEEPW